MPSMGSIAPMQSRPKAMLSLSEDDEGGVAPQKLDEPLYEMAPSMIPDLLMSQAGPPSPAPRAEMAPPMPRMAAPEPEEKKPGFFSRLFGKSKREESAPEARPVTMNAAPPAPQPAPLAPPAVHMPAPAMPPRVAAPASRPAGPPNRERVEAALRFLARQQSASGSFGDVGLTQLIVEAFAAAGETAKKGLYRRQLGRAEAFLAAATASQPSLPAADLSQLLAAQRFGGDQDGAVVGAGETLLMTALLVKLLCAAGL